MDSFLTDLFFGHPLWMWLGFIAVVAGLLAFDLGILHRTGRAIGVRESLLLAWVQPRDHRPSPSSSSVPAPSFPCGEHVVRRPPRRLPTAAIDPFWRRHGCGVLFLPKTAEFRRKIALCPQLIIPLNNHKDLPVILLEYL